MSRKCFPYSFEREQVPYSFILAVLGDGRISRKCFPYSFERQKSKNRGFTALSKNFSLISSRLLIRCGRKPEYPEKNNLTYRSFEREQALLIELDGDELTDSVPG